MPCAAISRSWIPRISGASSCSAALFAASLILAGPAGQIRVHLAHAGYPIVGDRVYGGRLTLPKGASEALRTALREFPRQALHAARLQLDHPVTGRPLECLAPLPDDMRQLLAVLVADVAAA